MKKEVTVLGLGSMGIKLAELLTQNGCKVTVWNRTISKAEKLTNVAVRDDINMAVAESPVIVICVYDYAATTEILQSVKNKQIFKGKIIINLTTGSPDEADVMERWLMEYGASYLNGALQVAPDQMGLADTTILLSGDQSRYADAEPVLRIFGGNLKYLGQKASLASAADLATLSWLYGSYIGLIYGAEMCIKAGLELDRYSEIITEIVPGFTAFFKHQLTAINNNDFQITQSPMSISISATRRIQEAYQGMAVNPDFWESITRLFAKADKMGLAGSELASIINVIRK